MRPNLHDILHRRLYITLTLCVTLLIITLLFSGFSIVFCAIGVGVGLVDSVIQIDELTGGKMLSPFSLPLLFAGGFIAALISNGWPSFGLEMQYTLVVFCVDLIVTLIFRGPTYEGKALLTLATMPLSDALTETVGLDAGTLISCVPGKLGYIELEGFDGRYILER